MSAIESLLSRRSVRKFTTRPVPKEFIEKIVAAGHRAATANNIQPWVFVVVTDANDRLKIKNMCPKNGPYIEFAPVCICVFCENVKYYLEDGCAATQNILNAAHFLGLGAVWVAGDKKEYADDIRKFLNVPENYKLVSLIPIGYADGETQLTTRKPLIEVLKYGKY